jgi:hypothetical protein
MTIVTGPDASINYDLFVLQLGVRRNIRQLERRLLGDGTLEYKRRGGLLFSACRAEQFITRVMQELSSSSYLQARPTGSGS